MILNRIREKIRWYKKLIIILMVASILEYAGCICSAAPGAPVGSGGLSAQEIVSKIIEAYSGLPTFKVRVENYYGEKKDKPDEILEATFKGSKLVSKKAIKPKPSTISTSIAPGLPVDMLLKMKPMDIKVAGTEEKNGIKHYILEAEEGPMKTVLVVNASNWTISKMEVYMEGKKLLTAEFEYAKIQGYFLPAEVQFTSTWGEKEEKSFGIYKDYRFEVQLAETEVGIFEGAERMKELKSMHPIVSLLEHGKYLISVSNFGHVFIQEKESKMWFKIRGSYSNVVEIKEGMRMTHGVPVDAAVVTDDSLWIGSGGGGLQKLNLKSGKVTRYMREQGLPTNTIGALAVQGNTLWIGCRHELGEKGEKVEGGLVRMDLGSGEMRIYPLDNIPSANGIAAIHLIGGRVWALFSQDKIKLFEEGGKSTSYYYLYIAEFDLKNNGFIPIKEASADNFFGGSNNLLWYSKIFSICYYNIETRSITKAIDWKGSDGMIKTGLATADKIWLSTDKGLYLFKLSTAKLTKLLDTKTTAILKAKDGIYVVSEKGFGKPKQIIKITEENGEWKLSSEMFSEKELE